MGDKTIQPCRIPPDGWTCTRPKDHWGPCAAVPDGDSLMIHVANAFRGDLLKILADMPEEAFLVFVAWADDSSQAGLHRLSVDARASIRTLAAAAANYTGR